MKKSIIITGPFASGKSYIPSLFLQAINSNYYVITDAYNYKTDLKYASVDEIKICLIDECVSFEKIKSLKKLQLKFPNTTFIFSTQEKLTMNDIDKFEYDLIILQKSF